MSTNSEEIVKQMVQEIREEMEALIGFVQAPPSEAVPTAYEMEGHLLQRLLAVGRQLLTLYFASQAERHRPETVQDRKGKRLPYFGEKRRSLVSLFGKVTFARSYYWAGNGPGRFPLDAALNLPEDRVSDRLREWREALGVDQAYQSVGTLLREFLGVATSSRSVQKEIGEDAGTVEAFYQDAEPPVPISDATLLIVQADGKGVPMVLPSEPERSVRLGKGKKTGRKKEAVVTAIYTQSPRVRTPKEVVQSLFDPSPPPRTSSPKGKEEIRNRRYFATLGGKAQALSLAAQEAERQDGTHITHRIALTDGSEALQERTREAFPDFTLTLDFIHADEYLWKAANALLGETATERTLWVRERAFQLLSGRTQTVIDEFQSLAFAAERSAFQRETLLKVAAYFERNRAFMRYDHYLALGWPIATGVIEGACRHLVKDRCERSGMRWTQAGAEALLRLRCVKANGDWQRFHAYRREKRHREVYGVEVANADLSVLLRTHTDPPFSLRLAA
jgi:hypothetical protein